MGQGPERDGPEADFGALEADSQKISSWNQLFEEIETSGGVGGRASRDMKFFFGGRLSFFPNAK